MPLCPCPGIPWLICEPRYAIHALLRFGWLDRLQANLKFHPETHVSGERDLLMPEICFDQWFETRYCHKPRSRAFRPADRGFGRGLLLFRRFINNNQRERERDGKATSVDSRIVLPLLWYIVILWIVINPTIISNITIDNLVGGFKHGFYCPFHIWVVILPIEELHRFSRWLSHHQPAINHLW